MVSKIQALRDECLERFKGKDELEDFQNTISFEGFNTAELKQFVKLCDNRIDISKTFLNVIIWIMGIIGTVFLILLSILVGKDIPILKIITIVLLSISFFVLLVVPYYKHHISNISGWTAFKEMALMYCPDELKK